MSKFSRNVISHLDKKNRHYWKDKSWYTGCLSCQQFPTKIRTIYVKGKTYGRVRDVESKYRTRTESKEGSPSHYVYNLHYCTCLDRRM